MRNPPFRPALLPSAATWVGERDIPFGSADEPPPEDASDAPGVRLRLGDFDPHLHCSVIGTCLTTAELRKLMRPFIETEGMGDLDVHHEAVRLAAQQPQVARVLGKALDKRHESAVQRFGRAKDAAAVTELWQQSLNSGEIPGAYWAVLTHRRSTAELRQRAFGEVHMLSHLVGAANRADIRRLVALERENAELRERLERQHERAAELIEARDRGVSERETLLQRLQSSESRSPVAESRAALDEEMAALRGLLGQQAARRETLEAQNQFLAGEIERLQSELGRADAHAADLARELSALESEFRSTLAPADGSSSALSQALAGRLVLYVGGRPSSIEAIRDLVLRHDGSFARHDGGIEDRKGLLAAAVGRADIVVFPVDCIDHDSATALKRLCLQLGKPFRPLRSASVASFATVLSASAPGDSNCGGPGPCRHHG